MKPTGWTLQYSDSVTKAVIGTVPLEGVGVLEGGPGKLVSMGIKCSFASQRAGTVTLRLPGIDPKTAPKIPFESPIVIKDGSGAPQFQGRRTDRPGSARPGQTSVSYTFEDAYYDLAHTTFKQAPTFVSSVPWPDVVLFQDNTVGPTLGGYVKTSDQIVRVLQYAISVGVNIQVGTIDLCCVQPALPGGYGEVGAVFTAPSSVDAANLADLVNAEIAAYVAQNAAYVAYIAGMGGPSQASLQAALLVKQAAYNAAQSAWLAAVNAGGAGTYTQSPPYGYYVPFYPSRCVKISEAIQFCLRVHPDCFTEIDYTTTPPKFNIRRRSTLFDGTTTPPPAFTAADETNYAAGTSMLAKNLPYSYTDANGLRHSASDIQPRPELQPKRIAIYYQITGQTSNGPAYDFIVDAYGYGPGGSAPQQLGTAALLNATEGIRAMDYSVNLAGPTTKTTTAVLNTLPFDWGDISLWQLKCQPLKANDITGLAFANPHNVIAVDNNGNDVSGMGFYIDSGSVAPWMESALGGAIPVVANVSADFTYTKKTGKAERHTHQFRIKLINYNSSVTGNFFSTTQTLSPGEFVPSGLAQGLFTVLTPMQYSLNHHILETKGFQGFVKPGKHCINLVVGPPDVVAGDQSATWASMYAAVQSSEYTLQTDGNGNVFAEFNVKCGPVEHLEAGELVQLMNLFTNRRTAEFDMSSRVGGGGGGSVNMPTDTEKENSNNSTPTLSSFNMFTPLTDGTGNPDSTKPQAKRDTADLTTVDALNTR